MIMKWPVKAKFDVELANVDSVAIIATHSAPQAAATLNQYR
jgi:hypothetical protein